MVCDRAFTFHTVLLVVRLFLWYQGQGYLLRSRSGMKVTFVKKYDHCRGIHFHKTCYSSISYALDFFFFPKMFFCYFFSRTVFPSRQTLLDVEMLTLNVTSVVLSRPVTKFCVLPYPQYTVSQ